MGCGSDRPGSCLDNGAKESYCEPSLLPFPITAKIPLQKSPEIKLEVKRWRQDENWEVLKCQTPYKALIRFPPYLEVRIKGFGQLWYLFESTH